jgi:hypothetical protein
MSFSQTPMGSYGGASAVPGYGPNARVFPQTITFTPQTPVQQINAQSLQGGGNPLTTIASIYIDNTNGPVAVTAVFPDTQQTITCPAYCAGWFVVASNSLVYNITAPLVTELGATFSVIVQSANYPVQQALYGPFLPSANTGSLDTPGSAGTWTTLVRTVPFGPPIVAGGSPQVLSYTSLEIDCTQFGGTVQVAGVDITGNPWVVVQSALTKSEFLIPATASGSSYTVTNVIPAAIPTAAVIPMRWRVTAIGEQPSYNVPIYMPSIPLTETTMSTGTTNLAILAAAVGEGFFVDSMSITSASWSVQFNLLLRDGASSFTFWEGAFAAGNNLATVNLGYISHTRNTALLLQVQNAGAAAGTLAVSTRAAYLNASQNG